MFARFGSLQARFPGSSLAKISQTHIRQYPLMQAVQSNLTLELEAAQAKSGPMKKFRRMFHRKEGTAEASLHYPMYLASEPVTSGEKLTVLNKYTSEAYCTVTMGGEGEVDKAIQAAEDALAPMAALKAYERKQILMNVVNKVKERTEEFARALAVEAGKPIHDSRGEVERLIITFETAAEEAVRLYGEYQPLDVSQKSAGYSGIVRRFPVGVCSFISPFNFPLNLVAHKVAPAIAAGCPFVLKPASLTPIGALMLGDILSKDELLPKGAFSIIPCARKAAGPFTTDERIKLLSFTGSPVVGWALKKEAGKKKVVLELGGNAACVVDELVPNLNSVVDNVVHGGFYQSGQSCISVQRLFVNSLIYEEFKALFVEKVSALKAGDPLDESTFIGPVISEKDGKRIKQWVDEAVGQGAKILCGGKLKGSIYDATVVENVPHKCTLFSEEVFGPVVCIESYDGSDFKKVIDLVNDSDYGLQAGVFTSNLNKAFYAFENIEAGGVVINSVPSVRVDTQPYGGVKSAGLGREGIRYAIEDMTELRIMLMKDAGVL